MSTTHDLAATPTMLERLAAATAVVALVLSLVIVVVLALENLGVLLVAAGSRSPWSGLGTRSLAAEPCAGRARAGGRASGSGRVDVRERRVQPWPWVVVAAAAALSVGAAGYALRDPKRPSGEEAPACPPRGIPSC